jgi:hypothetical protein
MSLGTGGTATALPTVSGPEDQPDETAGCWGGGCVAGVVGGCVAGGEVGDADGDTLGVLDDGWAAGPPPVAQALELNAHSAMTTAAILAFMVLTPR